MAAAESVSMPIPEDLILDRIRWKARRMVGPQVLDSIELTTLPDQVFGGMLASLQAEIYGKRGRECRKRIVATYPATWWDAFKRDLDRWSVGRRGRRLVRWWIARHPVRMDARVVTLDFSEQMLFPDNEIVVPPGLGKPVFAQTIGVQQGPLDGEAADGW